MDKNGCHRHIEKNGHQIISLEWSNSARKFSGWCVFFQHFVLPFPHLFSSWKQPKWIFHAPNSRLELCCNHFPPARVWRVGAALMLKAAHFCRFNNFSADGQYYKYANMNKSDFIKDHPSTNYFKKGSKSRLPYQKVSIYFPWRLAMLTYHIP